jgi:hypothetical protein
MSHEPYLKTLRRLPDDVVLDMATREFEMGLGDTCVCGWALRAGLSLANGETPDEVQLFGGPSLRDTAVTEDLAKEFGGQRGEWEDIWDGVCMGDLPDIELAFAIRLDEAVP